MFSKTSIPSQALIQNGYRRTESTDSMKAMKGEWHVALFQKRVRYDYGTAYFINIDVSDLKGSKIPAPMHGYLCTVSIQTVSKDHEDVYLNFEFDPTGLTIEEIEQLVHKFWTTFGSDYE